MDANKIDKEKIDVTQNQACNRIVLNTMLLCLIQPKLASECMNLLEDKLRIYRSSCLTVGTTTLQS